MGENDFLWVRVLDIIDLLFNNSWGDTNEDIIKGIRRDGQNGKKFSESRMIVISSYAKKYQSIRKQHVQQH